MNIDESICINADWSIVEHYTITCTQNAITNTKCYKNSLGLQQ